MVLIDNTTIFFGWHTFLTFPHLVGCHEHLLNGWKIEKPCNTQEYMDMWALVEYIKLEWSCSNISRKTPFLHLCLQLHFKYKT